MSDTTTLTPEERAELIAHVNSGYMTISGEGLKRALAALEQAEARAEKAEAENARLKAELEIAKQVAASAQAVAEQAWDGEIPSPLPGHKRANEDELLAQVEHLNCPLCGGSGHISDCDQTAADAIARLTKMVDWLANQLDCPSEFTNCAVDCAECRKEAASRAVAAGEEPCQK